MSSQEDNLTKELDSKLEMLFDEDSLSSEDSATSTDFGSNSSKSDKPLEAKTQTSTEVYKLKGKEFPLDNLNAVLLSLDWEINDELIESYVLEITRLQQEYQDQKYCVYFFKILENLAMYIKKNLGGAHPESVSMMQSIHQSLESIFLNFDIDDAQKKKIFLKEYNKYCDFKDKIKVRKNNRKNLVKDEVLEKEKFAEEFILRISQSLREIVREELKVLKQEILEELKK